MDAHARPASNEFTREPSLRPQETSSADSVAELKNLTRQLERARTLEAEFRAFADSARDYAFITLSLDETVIGWSKGAELLLGYSPGEILGRPGRIFFTPEDVERGEPENESSTALREGRAEDERWHMRKDGTRFWGSGVLTPLRNDSGELRGYAKVMRDRTGERQFQEVLRIREKRFRLLLENLRDCAVFELARNGQICVWNAGAERIFGYTAAEVLDVDATEFFAGAGYPPDAFRKELQMTLTSDRSEGEAWLTRKNGTRFFARWITNAVHSDDGEALGFIKVLRDETQREQAESEEQRRRQFVLELMEQQARATSSALGRTQAELTEIGRRLIDVQEQERRRIARDLHDHLAQRLALLETGLDRLRQGLPADLAQLRSEVASLQQQTGALADDVRAISHRLHPSIVEHLGLIPAVRSLCDEYRRSRVAPLHFEAASDSRPIPLDVATAYYRICEEALRNVQKHAGNVPVSVRIQAERSEIRLTVQDSGPGFNPDGVEATKHLGLMSMRERATLVGAICKCISEPGNGTTVDVRMIM